MQSFYLNVEWWLSPGAIVINTWGNHILKQVLFRFEKDLSFAWEI